MRLNSFMLLVAEAVALGALAGCAEPATCPSSVEEAIAPDSDVVSQAGLVAIGRVARYVDAIADESRGYDLDIRRVFAGSPSPDGTFLQASDPLPKIGRGEPVLVLAEPGSNPIIVVAGPCLPLQPITEQELIRWTGSR